VPVGVVPGVVGRKLVVGCVFGARDVFGGFVGLFSLPPKTITQKRPKHYHYRMLFHNDFNSQKPHRFFQKHNVW
jgi:hypothetical protein